MKVIMLTGPAGSGKSTTLAHVYNILMSFPGAQVVSPKTQAGGRKYDFKCVIRITPPWGGNDLDIAIFSMGDLAYAVNDAMIYYFNQKVDVLIIPNSGFLSPVKQLATYAGSVNLKKTVDIENQDRANAIDCWQIINNIP